LIRALISEACLSSFFKKSVGQRLLFVHLVAIMSLGIAVTASAQEDYGTQLAQIVTELENAEETAAGTEDRCSDAWGAVRKFIGPVDNPMEPRDKACASLIANNGQRLYGFDECSANHFTAYDEAHAKYRMCFDQQMGAALDIIGLSKKRLELDRLARLSARQTSSAPLQPNGRKGWLGFRFSNVSADDVVERGLPSEQGIVVQSIKRGSPAAKAGLLEDDLITAFNDALVSNKKSFQQQAGNLVAGEIIVLDVVRAGQRRLIYVVIEEK